MLGKLAPLHRAPPGCCISRAALLNLLGCQVAPKMTEARNAHGCCTALQLLLCCVPQSTGTASCSCRAFCPRQTCRRLTCPQSCNMRQDRVRPTQKRCPDDHLPIQLTGASWFSPAEALRQAYSVVFTFACNLSKIQHGT